MQGFDKTMTWNMFGRAPECNVWCAVPAELALPSFLFNGAWMFRGQQRNAGGGLPGLDQRVAGHGAALNGFYMFHMFEGLGEGLAAREDRTA